PTDPFGPFFDLTSPHLSAPRGQFRAGVLLQGPPHLRWIAVKPPRFQALRREQVEHVPGEFVALAEGDQCQALGWIEAKDVDGLQLLERLFKLDVGLTEFLDGCASADQGLSIRPARAGVQPLDLPPGRLHMEPMLPQRSDDGAEVRHGAQGCFIRPRARRWAWFGSLVALLSHDESPWFERLVRPVIRSGQSPRLVPHSSWDRQGGQENA